MLMNGIQMLHLCMETNQSNHNFSNLNLIELLNNKRKSKKNMESHILHVLNLRFEDRLRIKFANNANVHTHKQDRFTRNRVT